MTIQRNDWSLQRKGIIDQERHKDRVKEAIRKNLGSIVSNEAIILSDGKRTVKVPIRALDEYKFRFNYQKAAHRAHPERFVNGLPVPPAVPTAAWINKPNQQPKSA